MIYIFCIDISVILFVNSMLSVLWICKMIYCVFDFFGKVLLCIGVGFCLNICICLYNWYICDWYLLFVYEIIFFIWLVFKFILKILMYWLI